MRIVEREMRFTVSRNVGCASSSLDADLYSHGDCLVGVCENFWQRNEMRENQVWEMIVENGY